MSKYSGFLPAIILLFCFTLPGKSQVDARIFRSPDISSTQIAFIYAGDIRVVKKEGGMARNPSSPLGEEVMPNFSPDGSCIACTANYDGNQEVYVIPAMGGNPTRITFHPMAERMADWYPDGEPLLIASSRESRRQRYEGGNAPDIRIFNLSSLEAERITDHPATDANPMWNGDMIYFLSDRGPGKRQNIWVYNTLDKTTRQIKHFSDYDIYNPSIGHEDIVFQAADMQCRRAGSWEKTDNGSEKAMVPIRITR